MTEKSLDPLTLLVSLDANGRATGQLYEDAGDGYGYRNGDYRLTTYEASLKDGQVSVVVAKVEGNRPTAPTRVAVQVVTDAGVFAGEGRPDTAILVKLGGQ
jgi:alpha-glucosidase